MKGKIVLALICVAVILLSSYSALTVNADTHPAAGYETDTTGTLGLWNNRYFISNQYTVKGHQAYGINDTETTSAESFDDIEFGLSTAYWGIRAWKVLSDGSTQCITPSGTSVAVVSRSTTGMGLQTGTWSLSSGFLLNCSILIGIYYGITDNPDYNIANFTTAFMYYGTLAASTWTLSYYTRIYRGAGSNYHYMFYWGSDTYNSSIYNFQLTDLWVKLNAFANIYHRTFVQDSWYWQSFAMMNDTEGAVGINTCMEAGLAMHYYHILGFEFYDLYWYVTYWEYGTSNKHTFTYNIPQYSDGDYIQITVWRDSEHAYRWDASFYYWAKSYGYSYYHDFDHIWWGR
jgi:hypothetical protein